jgi:predicted metal-dependent hydrolase
MISNSQSETPELETMTATVRNLRFDLEHLPRHWHGGRKSVTSFFDSLSVFFPAGERFFVASVRAYQNDIKGDALRHEVRTFCAQEGIHSREHENYNDRLKREGYPVAAMEKRVEATLKRLSENAPKELQLAVTCALEHFTALMGHLLLGNPKLMEGADPEMAAMWRWHAAEENEHKCLPYDVYKAIGGRYGVRVAAMIGATAIFWAKVVGHQARMMRADGTLFSADEWGAVLKFLFIEPGGMFQLWGMYLQYFRPSFHPNDVDSAPLLDAWRAEYTAAPKYAHGGPALAQSA